MMMTPAFPLRLTYRDIFAGVLIVLLAFGLRVVVVFDRAAGDPAFLPPAGTDQAVYWGLAQRYEAGSWPDGPFHWQPGMVYFLVGARALVGDSVGMLRLVTSLAGALACGFLVGAGWLLTRRRRGGYAAGLLLAVYPVTLFYTTEFLTETPAVLGVAIVLFLALWQTARLALWRSALLGAVTGLTILTRTNLAVLWLAWLALLVLEIRRPRLIVLHAAVSLVFLALVVAPVTLYNRQAARGDGYPLVSSTGMDEVYRANNRDATGVRSTDPAMLTVDGDYLAALLVDIRLNPLRVVELQLRKTGLYWSELESGNNIDYLQSGEAVSPLLRAIPLDFRALAFFGWLGVVALAWQRRRLAIWFALLHLLLFASVMPLWIEGRLKQPSVVPLALTAAALLPALADLARGRQWQTLIRRYALPALALLLALAGLRWAVDELPQTRPVAGLPADARPLEVVWDGQLKLLGWRTLPDWPAAERGWTHFQRSYVVQLYWQVSAPVDVDYNVFLAYVVDGTRVAGIDRAIGAVSFFPKRTSQWQPGEIYAEVLGFKLPPDSPLEQGGDIRLGVYRLEGDDETGQTLIPVQAEPMNADAITLQRLAVYDLGYQQAEIGDRTASRAVFGDLIVLDAIEMPASAAPGTAITIKLNWLALADTPTDYTLFVHLVDESGELVAQVDTPPRGNTLPTSTWPPYYPLQDEIRFIVPETPGSYRLYLGWYDALTFDRLPVAGSLDGRLYVGELRVEG